MYLLKFLEGIHDWMSFIHPLRFSGNYQSHELLAKNTESPRCCSEENNKFHRRLSSFIQNSYTTFLDLSTYSYRYFNCFSRELFSLIEVLDVLGRNKGLFHMQSLAFHMQKPRTSPNLLFLPHWRIFTYLVQVLLLLTINRLPYNLIEIIKLD